MSTTITEEEKNQRATTELLTTYDIRGWYQRLQDLKLPTEGMTMVSMDTGLSSELTFGELVMMIEQEGETLRICDALGSIQGQIKRITYDVAAEAQAFNWMRHERAEYAIWQWTFFMPQQVHDWMYDRRIDWHTHPAPTFPERYAREKDSWPISSSLHNNPEFQNMAMLLNQLAGPTADFQVVKRWTTRAWPDPQGKPWIIRFIVPPRKRADDGGEMLVQAHSGAPWHGPYALSGHHLMTEEVRAAIEHVRLLWDTLPDDVGFFADFAVSLNPREPLLINAGPRPGTLKYLTT